MILWTKLNGTEFVRNADKIKTLESTPDTMIQLDGGEKLIVKESAAEVVRRSIDYTRRSRRPLTN